MISKSLYFTPSFEYLTPITLTVFKLLFNSNSLAGVFNLNVTVQLASASLVLKSDIKYSAVEEAVIL